MLKPPFPPPPPTLCASTAIEPLPNVSISVPVFVTATLDPLPPTPPDPPTLIAPEPVGARSGAGDAESTVAAAAAHALGEDAKGIIAACGNAAAILDKDRGRVATTAAATAEAYAARTQSCSRASDAEPSAPAAAADALRENRMRPCSRSCNGATAGRAGVQIRDDNGRAVATAAARAAK